MSKQVKPGHEIGNYRHETRLLVAIGSGIVAVCTTMVVVSFVISSENLQGVGFFFGFCGLAILAWGICRINNGSGLDSTTGLISAYDYRGTIAKQPTRYYVVCDQLGMES